MADLALGEISVSGSLSAPNLSRLTTGAINGTGAFDVLMQTMKLHLQEEYRENRITGDEYTQVYLGGMQSMVAQAVQFLLNHAQEEKALAEIGLIRQKTVTELVQTDDLIVAELGFNDGTDIGGMMKWMIDAAEQDKLVKEAQVGKLEAESGLIGQKVVTELAQTDDALTGAQSAGFGFNDTFNVVEGIVSATKVKWEAEGELVKQKVVTEVAQVSDVLPTDYGKSVNGTAQALVLATIEKTAAEVTLLEQKGVTELAQTADKLPANLGLYDAAAITVMTGVTGKQKDLYTQQIAGFLRDAEQKLAKIVVDAWSTAYTTDPDANDTSNTGLDNPGIGQVVEKAKEGINVAPPVIP